MLGHSARIVVAHTSGVRAERPQPGGDRGRSTRDVRVRARNGLL